MQGSVSSVILDQVHVRCRAVFSVLFQTRFTLKSRTVFSVLFQDIKWQDCILGLFWTRFMLMFQSSARVALSVLFQIRFMFRDLTVHLAFLDQVYVQRVGSAFSSTQIRFMFRDLTVLLAVRRSGLCSEGWQCFQQYLDQVYVRRQESALSLFLVRRMLKSKHYFCFMVSGRTLLSALPQTWVQTSLVVCR